MSTESFIAAVLQVAQRNRQRWHDELIESFDCMESEMLFKVHQATGLAPAEFKKLSSEQQIPFLESTIKALGKDPDETLKSWPKLSEVEKITGINRGVVSRLIDENKLSDNGHTGRNRRVDPVSLTRYCEANKIVFEWTGQ